MCGEDSTDLLLYKPRRVWALRSHWGIKDATSDRPGASNKQRRVENRSSLVIVFSVSGNDLSHNESVTKDFVCQL